LTFIYKGIYFNRSLILSFNPIPKRAYKMKKVDKLLNDLLKANKANNKKVINDFNNQNERLIKLLAEVNNAKF